MSDPAEKGVPVLLWPFYAIWRFATFILKLVGRIICAIIGLACIAAGTAISLSIVAAPVGVPFVALGFLLLVRAIF